MRHNEDFDFEDEQEDENESFFQQEFNPVHIQRCINQAFADEEFIDHVVQVLKNDQTNFKKLVKFFVVTKNAKKNKPLVEFFRFHELFQALCENDLIDKDGLHYAVCNIERFEELEALLQCTPLVKHMTNECLFDIALVNILNAILLNATANYKPSDIDSPLQFKVISNIFDLASFYELYYLAPCTDPTSDSSQLKWYDKQEAYEQSHEECFKIDRKLIQDLRLSKHMHKLKLDANLRKKFFDAITDNDSAFNKLEYLIEHDLIKSFATFNELYTYLTTDKELKKTK